MAINTTFNAAAAAYGNASRLINQAAKPATDLTALAPSGGQNFAEILASQVQGVVDTGKTSDKMAMDMVNGKANVVDRSEEHTSELQSRENLVCRLLLEKK